MVFFPTTNDSDDPFLTLRENMVERQLRGRDITDERVLAAMRAIPRHEFVPPERQSHAYEDRPLPIGHGQTISQPYIVALMTQLAGPTHTMRALDVGTGCGYQAAVLSKLVDRVFSLEIVAELAETAARRLARLGYNNVFVRVADGSLGWEEEAPFEVILAAASPTEIPWALKAQLAIGGRLILPVGSGKQQLVRVTRLDDDRYEEEIICPVSFVPMTGKRDGA